MIKVIKPGLYSTIQEREGRVNNLMEFHVLAQWIVFHLI